MEATTAPKNSLTPDMPVSQLLPDIANQLDTSIDRLAVSLGNIEEFNDRIVGAQPTVAEGEAETASQACEASRIRARLYRLDYLLSRLVAETNRLNEIG